MVTKEELQKLTRPELSQYSREHGIKGYSGKTKADRITLILNYYKSEKQPAKKQVKVKSKKEYDTPPLTKIINGKKYRRNPEYSYSSIERAEAYAKLLKKETIIDSYKQLSSDGKQIFTYYFYWIRQLDKEQPKKVVSKSEFYIRPTSDVVKRKKIEKIKSDIDASKREIETLKRMEDYYSKKWDEDYDNAIKFPDKYKYYNKQGNKKRYNYYNKIDEQKKNIDKYYDKIVEVNLDFSRVNRIVKKVFFNRESKWLRGRITGNYTTGYEITKPYKNNPQIIIRWNSSSFASFSKQIEDVRIFEDKLIPVLKLNNIKFKKDGKGIIIELEKR